jgi:hypothetical protein
MKLRTTGGVFLAILVGTALLMVSRPQQQAAAQAPAKSQQWEYKVVDFRRSIQGKDFGAMTSRLTDEFDKLGKDGWEYVGDGPHAMGFSVFKRSTR